MTKRTRTILLLLIIAVGGLLRFTGLYWAQGFRSPAIFDELNAYDVALRFLAGDIQTFYLGQPHFNNGHVPGPLWALLWAVPLRIGGRPEAVMLVILLLNVLSIYFVFVLANRLFGEATALWAALFYATSPWPVYFSVGCWNPEVTALLGALLFLALWQVVTRPVSPAIFWVCLLLAISPQFHMFVVFLVPPIIFLLSSRYSELNKKWLATGLLVAASLYLPYLVGEAAHGWQNTRLIFSGREPFTWGSLKTLTIPISCLSNLITTSVGNTLAEYKIFGDRVFGSFIVLILFNGLSLVLALIWLGSFLKTFVRELPDRWYSPKQALAKSPAIFFVGALLILPILLFVFTGHNFSSRYCIPLFPLLFLLPAIFTVSLARLSQHRRLLLGASVLTISFNMVLSLAFFHYKGQLIAQASYFVPSFQQMETVYNTLKTSAGPNTRIQIDTSEYSEKSYNLWRRGVSALTRYIQIREQFPLESETTRVPHIFYARQPGSSSNENERVAYRSPALVITE